MDDGYFLWKLGGVRMYKIFKMKLDVGYGSLIETFLADDKIIKQVEMLKKLNPELLSDEDLGKYTEFTFNFSEVEIKENELDEKNYNFLKDIDVNSGNYYFIEQALNRMKMNLCEDYNFDEEWTDEVIGSKILEEGLEYTVEEIKVIMEEGKY